MWAYKSSVGEVTVFTTSLCFALKQTVALHKLIALLNTFVVLGIVQTQRVYFQGPNNLFIKIVKILLTFDSLAACVSQAVQVLH